MPTAKQIAVWRFVTSFAMNAMLSPCTVGLGCSLLAVARARAGAVERHVLEGHDALTLSVDDRRPRSVAHSPGIALDRDRRAGAAGALTVDVLAVGAAAQAAGLARPERLRRAA